MKLASRIFKREDHYITSPYGDRINPVTGVKGFHYGTDYGTNVQKWKQYALEKGTVTKKGYNASGAGNYIYVEYPRLGITCLHYHLDKVSVNLGDAVDENTVLGTTGTTGQSTDIHLHLGVLKGGYYIDPESYDYVEETIPTPAPTKTIDELAHEVIEGKWGNGTERFDALDKAGYDSDAVQKRVNELLTPVVDELKQGDTVVITGAGNASSNGNSYGAYGIGWTRTILKVWTGRLYPYQVGNSSGTTGFYKAEDLRKVV